jgi:hypothetical protein
MGGWWGVQKSGAAVVAALGRGRRPASKAAKQSFADKCVPKLELGNKG